MLILAVSKPKKKKESHEKDSADDWTIAIVGHWGPHVWTIAIVALHPAATVDRSRKPHLATTS